MSLLLQQSINALALGSLYALIALGYTLVYGVLRLINFAHGDVFMVGAYLGLLGLALLDLPLPLALTLAVGGCALLGIAIERGAYRPLRNAPRLASLITAIGVALLLENLGLLTVGAEPRGYPALFTSEPYPWLERRLHLILNQQQVVILLVAGALMLGLQFIVMRTRFGKAMRAVSFDREAAELMGIDSNRVIVLTFALGSGLAGAGGVLYGIYYGSIDPLMGIMPGLKAFVAAVLGGIGSVPGAMVGGLLMGVAEVGVSSLHLRVSPTFVLHGSMVRDAVAFLILIVILLLRPTGLFGAKREAVR